MAKNVIKQILEKFSAMFNETKKILQQDVVYGARLGKIKIKELKLEQKKLEKLIEIGRKTYFLYKKGLIDNQELKQLCNQLSILESQAKIYHSTAQEYKKKIRL